jgi:hypothetical protein
MKENTNVPVMVTISKEKKDELKRIVSAMNLKDPDANKTVSGLSREILEDYLKAHAADMEDLVV